LEGLRKTTKTLRCRQSTALPKLELDKSGIYTETLGLEVTCSAVYQPQTFRGNISSPSSGLKSEDRGSGFLEEVNSPKCRSRDRKLKAVTEASRTNKPTNQPTNPRTSSEASFVFHSEASLPILRHANEHLATDATVNCLADDVLDCEISGQAKLRAVLISAITGRHNTQSVCCLSSQPCFCLILRQHHTTTCIPVSNATFHLVPLSLAAVAQSV
jgi:hypothetical protein